jgi:hypothetical protein
MNAPAMPGRSMTWRKWLDEYDPVELDTCHFHTKNTAHILDYLKKKPDQDGTAIGDEWRSVDGRWSMRGKEVQRATDPNS